MIYFFTLVAKSVVTFPEPVTGITFRQRQQPAVKHRIVPDAFVSHRTPADPKYPARPADTHF